MKPNLINNIEFAEKGLTMSEHIPPATCKRLAEIIILASKNLTDIRYTLSGAAKKLQLPSLHLTVDAKLPVICQRCLEEMQLDFALAFDYAISNTAPTEADESDEIDWLEASSAMNIDELVEDELLIAMPIAPMHETDCLKASMQSGEKPNPFAVLKGRF